MQLDGPRARSLLERERLDRLRERDDLRPRRKDRRLRCEAPAPARPRRRRPHPRRPSRRPSSRGDQQRAAASDDAACHRANERCPCSPHRVRGYHRLVSTTRNTRRPAPVYADRTTGQVFPDATAMVNAYLARFAERAGSAAPAARRERLHADAQGLGHHRPQRPRRSRAPAPARARDAGARGRPRDVLSPSPRAVVPLDRRRRRSRSTPRRTRSSSARSAASRASTTRSSRTCSTPSAASPTSGTTRSSASSARAETS